MKFNIPAALSPVHYFNIPIEADTLPEALDKVKTMLDSTHAKDTSFIEGCIGEIDVDVWNNCPVEIFADESDSPQDYLDNTSQHE